MKFSSLRFKVWRTNSLSGFSAFICKLQQNLTRIASSHVPFNLNVELFSWWKKKIVRINSIQFAFLPLPLRRELLMLPTKKKFWLIRAFASKWILRVAVLFRARGINFKLSKRFLQGKVVTCARIANCILMNCTMFKAEEWKRIK